MVLKALRSKNILFRKLNIYLIFLIFFVVSSGTATDLVNETSIKLDSINNISSNLNTENGPPIEIPGNETKIQIQAGDLTRLRLRDQLQINLSLQEQSELCINISDSNPVGPIPSNVYRFRNFYQFELNSSTNLQASFEMPFDTSELPLNVTPERLSWAYFNTYMNSWEYVHSWLNEEKNSLMTQTNHFSTWTILTYQDNNSVSTINMQGNGSYVKLQSQQQYQIKLESKFQLNVSFGSDVDFSINESDTIPFQYSFENHNRFGNFWTLETNNSNVEVNATFGFPYDPASLPYDINPEQLRFYYFNTSLNQWQMSNSWTNTSENMIYSETNHFSTWTIFSENETTKPIEPKKDGLNEINANGTAMKIENGTTYRFKTQSGFELNLSLSVTAELKMNESLINKYQNFPSDKKGIGKYLELELNETGVTIQATLAYQISQSDIPEGLNPLQLKFAYFNTLTNQWQEQESWVDDLGSDKYMINTNTSHFSTWTIIGSETQTTSSTSIESSSSSTKSAPGFEIFAIFTLLLSTSFKKKIK
jgi:hypothetical protein